jgi:DNA-directed RNA polymerase specialized sigma24 family protein
MQEILIVSGMPVAASPLSNLRKQYGQGLLTRKDFEGRIFEFILENYQRFHLFHWDRETCTDYLCWLYPRLSRAIDAYKDVGASFDAYIASVVHWSAKEYRSREADHHVTEYACWEARAEEVAEREPAYMDVRLEESGKTMPEQKKLPNPRQILILLLKSYFFVSDDFITRVAPYMDISPEKLLCMIDKLRMMRFDRDEEIRDVQERLHCEYYRCLSYQKRLNAQPEGSSMQAKMEGRLERARMRYKIMKERLMGMGTEASNRQIAEVMGIPKGTVDSTLHAIKEKIKRGIYTIEGCRGE